jgi:hypothetical protein
MEHDRPLPCLKDTAILIPTLNHTIHNLVTHYQLCTIEGNSLNVVDMFEIGRK